jgi:hypothetical protein
MKDSISRPRCEREDARPAVAAVLAGSLAAIVAACVLAGLLVAGRRANRGAPFAPQESLFQNSPAERTDVERAWESIDAGRAGVDGYSWADRRAGIVRIPIGRAIDLVCAEQNSAAASRAR